MSLQKDLNELLQAGILSPETADKIRAYYQRKGEQGANRLFIVFGILGAILVGLGIILIVAHNWDHLSRGAQTFFAFLPLVVGQLVCGYTLLKRSGSVAWREASTAFLFFAVGACISLISQIYHIPGALGSFLFTWMLLCFPLIYVMRSSIASLLYLGGITYFALEAGFDSGSSPSAYWYWLLLLGVFPHYFGLYKKSPESNFLIFHHWLIPLSVVISLVTLAKGTEEFLFVAYLSLFSLFSLIGDLDFFARQKSRNSGYRTIGSLGALILLLILSFDAFWEELRRKDFVFREAVAAPECLASILLTIAAAVLFFFLLRRKKLQELNPMGALFWVFIPTFVLGIFAPGPAILINLMVFSLGILTIAEGARKDHLGILNYGLLIITALVISRFFDTNLSFVLRGILFVAVGAGFFGANYWMLKKRQRHE